uniref:Proline rich 5 n=1 Tax=Ficedula albicollis TaxID=59894 RepID=A0A803WCN4_FICAL
MRTLRRLKFMSSPSLSDLGKREQAALDERGTQQRRACSNATWNSIHNGVIAVFQRKGLPDHELYNLNEGVRQLLKTELGSFFTEYLQVGLCFLYFNPILFYVTEKNNFCPL